MPPTKLQWHGFDSLIGFIRATVSLGAVIAGGLWAMLTWAMDDRYVKHEDLQAAVVDIKHTIKDSARQVQCEALLDDIQRLEQTILHKTRSVRVFCFLGCLFSRSFRPMRPRPTRRRAVPGFSHPDILTAAHRTGLGDLPAELVDGHAALSRITRQSSPQNSAVSGVSTLSSHSISRSVASSSEYSA